MKKFTNRLKLFYSLAAMFITFGVYSQTAEEYLSMGNIKGNLEDLGGSVTGNKNAAMNYPGNPVPEISSPEPTSKFTDYKGAIDFYTKAIDLNPEYELAYFNRGMTYYNRAVERGLAYNNIHEYCSAMADFTIAVELNPTDGENYYNRGLAELELGQKENAYADFSKAGELGYVLAFDAIRKYCK